ncbi:antibiotic biosynthesis monooxygenase family protein [Aurantimonas endophytica]|uniref:Quinol monooxygenase YgiN n=1 Tax=Aurantimonas endophytica TaxID=1522175 RepID=A0A7W6H9U9_9HYPH|nr:antibiotic biosynthesis monooxygenase family protein [Aurantimonas endophytica]MBB4001223.1 quinol monooxygenase YgiN [Aurantimonas endophytica]MCO6403127.1 hypothetical protein [Aurantimonas endophytica]
MIVEKASDPLQSIKLLTRFEAPDAQAAEAFLLQLQAVRASVEEEPGHVAYEVYRSREQSTVLFVVEEWRTQNDADLHVATVTAGEEARSALALLSKPPVTVTLVAC